jgi:phospholipase C
MRKSSAASGLLLISALALATAVAGPTAQGVSGSPTAAAPSASETPIEHVVIIYQENHTFDDVLGAVCQTRTTTCNGYTGPVTFADGTTAANITEPDIPPDVTHNPAAQQLALSNQWDKIGGCLNPPYRCVTHFDPSGIPNLAKLANTFAVSDATFAAGDTASFGAHVNLAAGTIDGFVGYNPMLGKHGQEGVTGWGCKTKKDVLWGPPDNEQMVPSCIPDQAGKGPYRPSPVPYTTTLMEQLEAAGLTWHIYQGGGTLRKPYENGFSFCTYFYWCLHNRYKLPYDSSTQDFVDAAAAGTLPDVSILVPGTGVSQHNGRSMAVGDNYIGHMVSSVENGSEWNSTAIFITYDDCGCFYDHVTPPSGLGLRNPMVIVSPWAIPGYTDSTTAVQPYSMLAFVDYNFDLPPLTTAVAEAYDYSNSFDFTQRPLAGPRMTHTRISAHERARLAKLLPREEDDET